MLSTGFQYGLLGVYWRNTKLDIFGQKSTYIYLVQSIDIHPQVIYKPHCLYQNFSPLANGLYFIATTNKTPLRNGNCPVTNPITEMGVARTIEPKSDFQSQISTSKIYIEFSNPSLKTRQPILPLHSYHKIHKFQFQLC